MQHLGKAALRVTKNYTKGYSDTQAKVREATSNDPWGPSGTQMNEIAQLTYNQGDFVEIMEMLDKRLNDKGKNWRHVFKSLTLLDYCLHAGSENVVIYFRDNLYVIKTLKEFQYIDEEGKDQGANVRQKAKDITNLLQDESRLREERRSRAHMRDRMIKANGGEEGGPSSFDEDENVVRRRNRAPGAGAPKEEDELKRAIEESKRSHAVEQAKAAEERDLEQAIKLSEEEEAKRHKAVEDSNSSALFDDTNQLPPPTTTNPFPLSDANPYANLQPQFTQLQPQFTSMQPQFTAAIQPQFTSFNPYQQQAQQEALQAEYLRQQQEFLAQQQAAQQQQQQEEWLRQQQLLQMQQQQAQQAQLQQQNTSLFTPQQPLAPQPTGFGTNNPFAPSPSAFSPAQLGPSPTASRGPSFNLQGTYANSSAPSFTSSPSITPSISHSSSPVSGPGQSRLPAVKTKNDEQHAQLASLFANKDDGMDTFGNTGILRYGQSDAARLVAAQTGGHNPFARQQQQQGADKPFFDI